MSLFGGLRFISCHGDLSTSDWANGTIFPCSVSGDDQACTKAFQTSMTRLRQLWVGGIVKTPDDKREELPWLTNNPIPAANPEDLKTLWKLENDLEKQYGRRA